MGRLLLLLLLLRLPTRTRHPSHRTHARAHRPFGLKLSAHLRVCTHMGRVCLLCGCSRVCVCVVCACCGRIVVRAVRVRVCVLYVWYVCLVSVCCACVYVGHVANFTVRRTPLMAHKTLGNRPAAVKIIPPGDS
jgi:hypothetical protein